MKRICHEDQYCWQQNETDIPVKDDVVAENWTKN